METDFQDAKEKELIDEQPKGHQTRSRSKRDALIINLPGEDSSDEKKNVKMFPYYSLT